MAETTDRDGGNLLSIDWPTRKESLLAQRSVIPKNVWLS
jgi:hypothetical protein